MTQTTDAAIAEALRLSGNERGDTVSDVRSRIGCGLPRDKFHLAHARSLDTITALQAKLEEAEAALSVAQKALGRIADGRRALTTASARHFAAEALAQIGSAKA